MEVLRIKAAGEIVSLDSFRKSPAIAASYAVQLNLSRNTLSSIRSMSEAVDTVHEAVAKEINLRAG